MEPLEPEDWQLLNHPPSGWGSPSGINSIAWQTALSKGLHAQTVYAWSPLAEDGFAVPVFSKYGVRIGYLGFPISRSVHGRLNPQRVASSLVTAHWPIRIDGLRVTSSSFDAWGRASVSQTAPMTETAITHLCDWNEGMIDASARRNIRQAVAAGVTVRAGVEGDAMMIYRLYAGAVEHHRGTVRYSEAYFAQLMKMSQALSGLKVYVAQYRVQTLAFLVVMDDGGQTWYLHGGTDRAQAQYRPSDLLFYQAITEAQQRSQEVFNFLTTPPGQVSLQRYKEKWGAETRPQLSYFFPARSVRGRLATLLIRIAYHGRVHIV